jgi:pimeloyl-ACP methyl ester carboxylesterase
MMITTLIVRNQLLRRGVRQLRLRSAVLMGSAILAGGAYAATPFCDDGMKAISLGDSLAKITSVLPLKPGDIYPPTLMGSELASPKAGKDMCLVSIMVGPGNPGEPGSRSTSSGIGIQVLLPAPADWNRIFVGIGSGGYSGGGAYVSTANLGYSAYEGQVLAEQGYVIAGSNDGHENPPEEWTAQVDGSFLMRPDGSINARLLEDFSHRALNETAVKTKALIAAYYGKSPDYSYFLGGSSGGREAMKLAQLYPDNYNGIVSGYPAMNWTRFVPTIMWPQIVMQQDLGATIAASKLAAVDAASFSACDTALTGQSDGYVSDVSECRYDPARDIALLCADGGGGNNAPACLTRAEAQAINKIWYGPRSDGAMIDPTVDNGWNPQTLAPGQLWFGQPRGAPLAPGVANGHTSMAAETPFPIGSNWLPLVLGDSAYGTAGFVNETGNGRDLWKTISYTGANSFSAVFEKSVADFATTMATDDPDLSAFKAAGGKLIHYHGMADAIIAAGGSTQYAERLRAKMGVESVNEFYRYYLVPGMGHGSVVSPLAPVPGGLTTSNSTYSSGINFAILPALREWVENGKAPNALTAVSDASGAPARSRPWCPYPEKLKYLGGDVNAAASFRCE